MVTTGFDVSDALHEHSPFDAQLQATLNLVPAYAWYALPSGALTFVNERTPIILVCLEIILSDTVAPRTQSGTLTRFCIRTIGRRRGESGRTVCAQARPEM